MKPTDLFLTLLCVAGAIAGYFLLVPPESWMAIGACALFLAWVTFSADSERKPILRIGGVSWSLEDFVRGWLITGRTGSGKTQCAINAITFQIFENVPTWGGICLDQKGLYWEILIRMAARFGRKDDLVLLQTRPVSESALWRPPNTINITGNPSVPSSTYAKVIVDTATSLTGGRGQNPFFPVKAQLAIQLAFDALRHVGAFVTIPNVRRILMQEEDSEEIMQMLVDCGDQRGQELLKAFSGFLEQPPEQLGGVQGSISTYLDYFLADEIAEVFCAQEPTFSMSEIDSGKIVCIAMPQKFQTERLYINTILKLSFYFHALSRFDKSAEERENDNLIILFADEGQEIITGAESAFADHRAAGVIREAKATIVLATQAYTSLLGALDKRYADVLMLNLSNEIIFTCANDDSAVIASKNIGEREVTEKSWGTGSGRMSYNYRRVVKPFFPPHELRRLRKFTAIIRHCEKRFRRRLIPPITPEGAFPNWFTGSRPHYAVLQ
ncbi:MAG: type IV secretion system DNA-binding domain-containing protein, partial [Chthoniobacterales bacterium]